MYSLKNVKSRFFFGKCREKQIFFCLKNVKITIKITSSQNSKILIKKKLDLHFRSIKIKQNKSESTKWLSNQKVKKLEKCI